MYLIQSIKYQQKCDNSEQKLEVQGKVCDVFLSSLVEQPQQDVFLSEDKMRLTCGRHEVQLKNTPSCCYYKEKIWNLFIMQAQPSLS